MKQNSVVLLLLSLTNIFCVKIQITDTKSNLKQKPIDPQINSKINEFSPMIYQNNNKNIIINTSLLKQNEMSLIKGFINILL